MLKPNKYTSLQISLLGISGQIIKYIKNKRIIKYYSLIKYLTAKTKNKREINRIKNVCGNSLNLLFLLGLIEYHIETDSFEYIGE